MQHPLFTKHLLWFVAFAAILCPQRAQAKDAIDNKERLIDREPFDQIILDAANKNYVLEVELLEFQGRNVPSPFPKNGQLKFRLVDNPTKQYQVRWMNVKEIKLFEQMILVESKQLSAAGKYDEAYDYLLYLRKQTTPPPGLEGMINEYLYRSAFAAFKDKKYEDALSIITALHEREPSRAGLARATNRIAKELINQKIRMKEYASARTMLNDFPKRFSSLDLPALVEMNNQLSTLANQQLAVATKAFQEKTYEKARSSVRTALSILPQSADASRLMQQIHRARPQVIVGVDAPYTGRFSGRLDDWASRRAEGLLRTKLVQQRGYGNDGGIYSSPLGELVVDATGLQLTLLLDKTKSAETGLTAFDLSRKLYRVAKKTPGVSLRGTTSTARLNRYIASLKATDAYTLQIRWKQQLLAPAALLQIDLSAKPGANTSANRITGPFQLSESASAQQFFVRQPNTTRTSLDAPIEIVERLFDGEDAAIESLRKGDIDVLDRVSPWSVKRLRGIEGIAVAEYSLPTVHALAFNPNSELLNIKEMRRALAYGINKKGILDRVILEGKRKPEFALLTGPFPAGRKPDNPIAFAYNRRISARSYDPRLATILSAVAWDIQYTKTHPKPKPKEDAKEIEKSKAVAKRNNAIIKSMRPLIFAHPPGYFSKTASSAIANQLSQIGFEIELVEMKPADIQTGNRKWDIRYMELAIWEPVYNAQKLFGPNGELDNRSAYMALALQELDNVTNRQDVTRVLRTIHEIARDEIALLPLWQSVNYYAYRKNIVGIEDNPVSLYDNIQTWQKTSNKRRRP